jgi:hypothetical protein
LGKLFNGKREIRIYDSFYPVIYHGKKNQWDTEPGAEAVFCGRGDNTLRFSNFMNGEKLQTLFQSV